MCSVKRVHEFLGKTGYANALFPSKGESCFNSVISLVSATSLFSEGLMAHGMTPLSRWQSSVVILFPIAIGSLPSYSESEESHYPLMIYDNVGKIGMIVTAIIISRKKGYHHFGGMCAYGGLILATKRELISIETSLTIKIGLHIVKTTSLMILTKSPLKGASIFILSIPSHLVFVAQFPSVNNVLMEKIKSILIELRTDQDFAPLIDLLEQKGYIDPSLLKDKEDGSSSRPSPTSSLSSTDKGDR